MSYWCDNCETEPPIVHSPLNCPSCGETLRSRADWRPDRVDLEDGGSE